MRRHRPPSRGDSHSRTVLLANPGADLYGSDRMVLETLSALRSAGFRVVVAMPGDGPLAVEVRRRGGEVEICTTPVIRKSAMRPAGMVRLIVDVILSIRPAVSLIRRVHPDVVYVNTITPPLWLLLARLLRRPSICHVHEGEASASPTVRRALYLPLFLGDHLIVNSKFSLGVLRGAFPSLTKRSSVVYNAVAGPSEKIPARECLDGAIRLLYVGRLSPRKGPDIAVSAVSILRARGITAQLDLVGAVFPGYEWFEAQLRDLVESSGIDDAITFHGFQSNVWPYAADADIVLVPSTVDEPFGNTAVEAILASRPLIVSAISGLLEASAGFEAAVAVRPGSATDIADAVYTIQSEWSHYRKLASVDSVRAAQIYGSSSYGEQVVSAVDAVGAG